LPSNFPHGFAFQTQLYDEAAAVFDYGNITVACQAYEELFSIFQIEDEYGHGIHDSDLENVDIDRVGARYLRAIYLISNLEDRAKILMEKIDFINSVTGSKPSLKEIIEITAESLPDFQKFLDDWINLAAKKEGEQFDAWLREGVKLKSGIDGLEKLAREDGLKRPRAYYDWITALMAEKKYAETIAAAKYALSQLTEKLPIRAAIADYLTQAAIGVNDEETAFYSRWLSFSAKPAIDKLLDLYETVKEQDRKHLLQDAAEVIKKHLKREYSDTYHQTWEQDNIEQPAHVSRSLLLHVYLLASDYESAFTLAQTGATLGWSSSDNPQPFFVAYIFISCNTKANNLPSFLQKFWNSTILTSLSEGWYSHVQENVVRRLANIYSKLLQQDNNNLRQYLSWCIDIAKQRIADIVKNNHRQSYEKAATLTAISVEVLVLVGETKKAVDLYTKIKKDYPRHSSFQKELKKVFAHPLLVGVCSTED
jgi:tetratricopeptide (TPR) repeat protein